MAVGGGVGAIDGGVVRCRNEVGECVGAEVGLRKIATARVETSDGGVGRCADLGGAVGGVEKLRDVLSRWASSTVLRQCSLLTSRLGGILLLGRRE